MRPTITLVDPVRTFIYAGQQTVNSDLGSDTLRVFLSGTSFVQSYGGPAVSVSSLAKALVHCGVEVGVWAPDGSATGAFAGGVGPCVRSFRGSLAKAIDSFGPISIIHDNGLWLPHNHALSRLADERLLSRIVSTRGMVEPWAIRHKGWKKRLAWRIYQKGDLQRAVRHHATSDQEAANLRRLGLGVPIVTIPNGVDLPNEGRLAAHRARLVTGREKVALFMGRIYPIKGLPMLVEAWGRVRPLGWRLHIAGPDQAGHRAAVERAIIANQISDRVSFLGPVGPDERMRVFASADLFVLPSYSESFGMAAAEALAHCLPVLTTTCVPWQKLTARGCGWSVEPTVEGLANALRDATSCNSETLREMGDRGREYVAADFSWSAASQSIVALYRDVMSSRLSKAPSM